MTHLNLNQFIAFRYHAVVFSEYVFQLVVVPRNILRQRMFQEVAFGAHRSQPLEILLVGELGHFVAVVREHLSENQGKYGPEILGKLLVIFDLDRQISRANDRHIVVDEVIWAREEYDAGLFPKQIGNRIIHAAPMGGRTCWALSFHGTDIV